MIACRRRHSVEQPARSLCSFVLNSQTKGTEHVGGQIDLSNIPEPIARVYRQALATYDQVEDPRLQRAMIGVMREVEKEATVGMLKTA